MIRLSSVASWVLVIAAGILVYIAIAGFVGAYLADLREEQSDPEGDDGEEES